MTLREEFLNYLSSKGIQFAGGYLLNNRLIELVPVEEEA